MHQKDWDLNNLAKTDGSVGSFGFNNGWTRSVVVVGFSHSPLFQFLGHPFDDFAVFCVDHGGEVVPSASQHDV